MRQFAIVFAVLMAVMPWADATAQIGTQGIGLRLGPRRGQGPLALENISVIRDRNLYPMKYCVGIYAGISMNPNVLRDAVDFELSDWERYGLRSDNVNNTESRAQVNMRSQAPRLLNPWINFGMQFYVVEQMSIQADFEVGMMKPVTGQSFALGVNYDFLRFDRKHQVVLGGSPMMVGLALRGGYSNTSLNYTAYPVTGYTENVDGLYAEFAANENIRVNYKNFYTKIGLRFTYRLVDQVAFQLEGGYCYMPWTSMRLRFEYDEPQIRDDVTWENPMIVQTDGSAQGFDVEPMFANSGPYLGLNIMFCITESMTKYRTGR